MLGGGFSSSVKTRKQHPYPRPWQPLQAGLPPTAALCVPPLSTMSPTLTVNVSPPWGAHSFVSGVGDPDSSLLCPQWLCEPGRGLHPLWPQSSHLYRGDGNHSVQHSLNICWFLYHYMMVTSSSLFSGCLAPQQAWPPQSETQPPLVLMGSVSCYWHKIGGQRVPCNGAQEQGAQL